jgi:hypothetical protein
LASLAFSPIELNIGDLNGKLLPSLSAYFFLASSSFSAKLAPTYFVISVALENNEVSVPATL